MRAIKFRCWGTIIFLTHAVNWLVNYPFDGISDAGDPITTPEDDYQFGARSWLIDLLSARVHVRCGSINLSNFDAGGSLSVRRAQLIDCSIIRSSLDGISDAGQLTHQNRRWRTVICSSLDGISVNIPDHDTGQRLLICRHFRGICRVSRTF